MPKIIKTKDINGKFEYETSISDYNEKNSKFKITVPAHKIKEKDISRTTKLKVTIEVLED